MGRIRVAAALVAVGAAVAFTVAGTTFAHGNGPVTEQVTITAADGTRLACGLVLPGGDAPTGGWPGLLLFPGLGQTHAALEELAVSTFAPVGLASLACDARGTGASTGKFDLAGPADVQDARDLFDWLAARPDVSDTAIGAFGESLGGGEAWNAAVAGVPFEALVPATTWTNLTRALAPGGVVERGLVRALAQAAPAWRWDPSLRQARADLLAGDVTAAVRAAAAARSASSRLHALTVPTLLVQDRHDLVFDIGQARRAYQALSGPKRLYVGDPAHALDEVAAWFERYLGDRGKRLREGVELAHDPWDGTTTFFATLPETRGVTVNLPGTKQLASGSLKRTVRLPGGPLETFGGGSVSVRYSTASPGYWSHLVAAVWVKGVRTPVTVGAARITKAAGVLRIPLLDEAVLLPRGKRLVVRLGQIDAGGLFTAAPAPPAGTAPIAIGRVTLHLSLLRLPVSR